MRRVAFKKIGYDLAIPKAWPPACCAYAERALEFGRTAIMCHVDTLPDLHHPSFYPHTEATMSENIKHITDASFEMDVLKSDKPVLVDFWAEWCGPCKMIAPILEEIANVYEGKLQVVKMDVDANQAVPAKFGIRGIPTLILFKNGAPAAQKVGAMAKGQLTSFIDSNI
jgi:thioredoxin 1